MRTQRSTKAPSVRGATFGAAMVISTFILTGCETDSWFDPSRTGYFEKTPSTMPVLTRLDVVERQTSTWQPSTVPDNNDLQPGELQYLLSAGDEIRVEVFELVRAQETDVSVRVIDPSGNIRLPTIGEVPASGFTIAQLQVEIEKRVKDYLPEPIVSVVLERGQGFSFVIYGAVENTGVYGINKPDFRLMEALALAGGTFSTTEKIFVIRSAALDPSAEDPNKYRGQSPGGPGTDPNAKPAKPKSIEDILNSLPADTAPKSETPPNPNANPPAPTPEPTPKPIEPAKPSAEKPSMGALGSRQTSPPTTPPADKPPILDVDELTNPKPETAAGAPPKVEPGWVWDMVKQEWVRSSTANAGPTGPSPAHGSTPGAPVGAHLYATRSIEIDYQQLAHGDSNLNVVIRPGDRIYVDPPLSGVVYIGGEISRPGVYELPRLGGKLTLSRLVDAAGGLTPIAIPQRCEIVRTVGPGRQATVRVDLAAIKNCQEPDLFLKPDDQVNIGTNFFAVPLAAIRNGFRMTYGFGFLIDRNFGNDVFGAPPVNVVGE